MKQDTREETERATRDAAVAPAAPSAAPATAPTTAPSTPRPTRYVGLDVHKATISVAIAASDGGEVRSYGRIENEPDEVRRLMKRLGPVDQLVCCYEAGPTGYVLQRQLMGMGVACLVAAPSLIPRRPGDTVKTDRRDAEKLARLLRSGELTGVWVPDEADEAVRDYTRMREATKRQQHRLRQQIGKLLLRLGTAPAKGVRAWTARHRQWLAGVRLEQPLHREILATMLEELQAVDARLEQQDRRLEKLAAEHGRAPLIMALTCLYGIKALTALTLVAELGDLRRFATARGLMGYVGMGPREHSSGGRVRRGGITRAGNAHVRRVVIESSWHARRLPTARSTVQVRRKGQPAEVVAIAERAERRLHGRYHRLVRRGKLTQVAAVAVGRELLGFIWAIGQAVGRDGGTALETAPDTAREQQDQPIERQAA